MRYKFYNNAKKMSELRIEDSYRNINVKNENWFLAMDGKKRRKILCTVAYKTIEATKLYVRLEQGTFGTGSERHTTRP